MDSLDSLEAGLQELLSRLDALLEPVSSHADRLEEPGDETPPASFVTTSACQVCGRPLDQPKTGRPRKFCDTRCRTRAYRARKASRAAEDFQPIDDPEPDEDKPMDVTKPGTFIPNDTSSYVTSGYLPSNVVLATMSQAEEDVAAPADLPVHQDDDLPRHPTVGALETSLTNPSSGGKTSQPHREGKLVQPSSSSTSAT